MFRKYDQNVRKAIKKGVYNPDAEHDACGIGFVANIKNIKTNNIVQDGLSILKNLTHRGAVGADPKAGDGCGILTQMPDKFLRKVAIENNIELPAEGHYGVGNLFLPKNLFEQFLRVANFYFLLIIGKLYFWIIFFLLQNQ